MYEQNSVKFPDVTDVDLHQVCGGYVGCCWNEVGHLRQSVGDDVDGIETTRLGKFTNKIQLNPLPWAVWCRDWLELAEFLLVLMFCTLAHMTPSGDPKKTGPISDL
jgi:hypothetical protein